MTKNYVYIVMTEYRNFEDLDNNYAEVNGVFNIKEKALNNCYYRFIEELELEMNCQSFIYDDNNSVASLKNAINHQLEKFGYINFKQDCCDGECELSLIKKEVL